MSLFTGELFEVGRDGDRLTFRCTRGATAGTILVLTAAAAVFGLPLAVEAWDNPPAGPSLPGFLTLAVIPVGLLGLLAVVAGRWRTGHTLDRVRGVYRRGGREVCRLGEITAVVVIEQDPPDSGPTYDVFFALASGRRIKLNPALRPMSRKDEAERFARLLADFLGVEPLGNFRSDGAANARAGG